MMSDFFIIYTLTCKITHKSLNNKGGDGFLAKNHVCFPLLRIFLSLNYRIRSSFRSEKGVKGTYNLQHCHENKIIVLYNARIFVSLHIWKGNKGKRKEEDKRYKNGL